MNAPFFFGLSAAGLMLLATSGVDAQTVLYVDQDAPGPAHDGSTWCSAFTDLQDALDVAAADTTIRVADGTYTPDRGTGDRTATFQLIDGVTLEGGYAGCNAPDPDARDIALYETTLSGDLNGDDGPDFFNYDENSYHVATASGTDATATLDGFTISGGNADGSAGRRYGGGMYNHNGSPTLTNCTFIANTAESDGGGMHNRNDSNPTLTGCTFIENQSVSDWGGGMYNVLSSPTLTNCMFIDNTADGLGGGMLNSYGDATLTDCTFTGNSTFWDGGGVVNKKCSPTFTNCTFSGNLTQEGFGGGMHNMWANPTLTNCTFSENSYYGMYNERESSPTLTNCTFSGNDGAGMANTNDAHAMLTGCTFSGNNGHGMSNAYSSPTLTNCMFIANFAESYGGGMYNGYSNPTLTNCTFIANIAESRGGGMYNNYSSNPTLTNCTFRNNSARVGGGMHNQGSSSPTLVDCTFTGNSVDYDGGGMRNIDGSGPTLVNCTFIANTANRRGGGMDNWSGSPTLTNCTFAANWAPDGRAVACDSDPPDAPSNVEMANCILWDGGDEIWNNDGSTITITYCDIQGGWPGKGNIDVDPMFIDADGDDDIPGTEDDNLRLSPGSPCIDAADNAAVPPDGFDLDDDGDTDEPIPFDLDGNPRFIDDPVTPDTGNGVSPIVDMGAHEYQATCETAQDCNDGASCNGAETCVAGACQPGTALDCDDGIDCTDDSCDEDTDSCVHTPDDALCDNGLYCDGVETCDPVAGCQHPNEPAGTPCGDPSDSDCDNPDTCDGMGSCLDNLEPDGTVCPDDGDRCTGDFCTDEICMHLRWPADDPRACGACCFSTAGQCYDDQLEEECLGDVWVANDSCGSRTIDCERVIVPTVSEWGLVILSLLLSIGIATKFGRRRALDLGAGSC